jgi:outer membrane protein
MRRPLPLLMLLAFAGHARSEEALTWESAAALARENNLELKAARAQFDATRARYKTLYADFLPQVSANADWGRSGPGGGEDYSAGVSARQSLFAGFQDKAELERGRAELEAARASLELASAQVAFDLKTSFARLLFAQQQVDVTRTIEARRRENVRLVGLRFEAGREHKGAYLRSRASHRQAEFEAAQALRGRRVAQRDLARALGRSPLEALEAAGEFRYSKPAEAGDPAAQALNTPSYRQAEARAASARADVKIARGRFLPEISASASSSRGGADWFPDQERWSVGVGLSLPLFSGGRNFFGERAARAARDAAEAGFREAALNVALDLEDAHAGVQDAYERIAVQEEFYESSRIRAEIARSQYSSGLLSFDDWDIIENELINREKEALSAKRDAAIAEAAWDRARGKGL